MLTNADPKTLELIVAMGGFLIIGLLGIVGWFLKSLICEIKVGMKEHAKEVREALYSLRTEVDQKINEADCRFNRADCRERCPAKPATRLGIS